MYFQAPCKIQYFPKIRNFSYQNRHGPVAYFGPTVALDLFASLTTYASGQLTKRTQRELRLKLWRIE